ncbi:MAG: hypothetical protein CTY19_00765 [Methylomonas sp.]|jgi:hypothetical protein|nr:MAG: hypothetical protein CTY19_00765 [Methylomonas sp.]
MSILFFHLRGVPADEAEDIRELLTNNQITFYETSAGMFGISLPAIWLNHEDDLTLAQHLFDVYQQQRANEQRALYVIRRQQGHEPGFLLHNLRHPLRFIFLAGIIGLITYVSTAWVLKLGL